MTIVHYLVALIPVLMTVIVFLQLRLSNLQLQIDFANEAKRRADQLVSVRAQLDQHLQEKQLENSDEYQQTLKNLSARADFDNTWRNDASVPDHDWASGDGVTVAAAPDVARD